MSTKALELKKKKVKELKEKIDSATIIVISGCCGFTVKEITELRKELHSEDSEYSVLKNTLLERAMEEAGFAELKEYLSGSTALLFGYKDPLNPLKTLVKFVKDTEKGEIKAGIIEKAVIKKDQILEVAKLPSREVLLTKIIGGLQSPLYGLVAVLQGSIKNLVYALNAVSEKKEQ